MKYLGPWRKYTGFENSVNGFRQDLSGVHMAIVWRPQNSLWRAWNPKTSFKSIVFDSFEEASIFVDRLLIENGWRLLTEDQFNKLLVLK